MATIAQAQRKIDAIDKRIDLVRAEMCRVAGVDFDAFDFDTDEGQDAARRAATIARRDFPAYDGIERGLSLRRYDAANLRDRLIAREARAAERRALRQDRKRYAKARHACPTCGDVHFACAA